MTIRLIATDMDGTFLDDDGHFNRARFQKLLTEMTRQSVRFVVASGNHYPHLPPYFKNLEGAITYIAEDGAQIVNDGKELSADPISDGLVKQVLDWQARDDLFSQAWVILSGRQAAYTQMPKVSHRFISSSYFYANLTSVLDLREVVDEIFKIDMSWSHYDVGRQEKRFNAAFSGQLRATPSGFGGLDIVLPYVSKAYGLKKLQQQWGITPNETLAFGDSPNDIEMLKLARYGYAMKNATLKTQAAASFITEKDHNAEGVLDVVERMLKNN